MSRPLILASGSPHRRKLLEDAGIAFGVRPSTLDERDLEAPLGNSGATAMDIAEVLAEAKATDVSALELDAVVIGADQTLSLDGERLHKSADMEEARRALLALSGRTHELNSAVCLAQGGEAVWRYSASARITFRPLTPTEIGRYLAKAGAIATTSVGAYAVEGRGLQLIERIEGDFFTIVGLPMLPLLQALRERGALDV